MAGHLVLSPGQATPLFIGGSLLFFLRTYPPDTVSAVIKGDEHTAWFRHSPSLLKGCQLPGRGAQSLRSSFGGTDGPQDESACMPYLVMLSVVVAYLERARSSVRASPPRSPHVGVSSGCRAWS